MRDQENFEIQELRRKDDNLWWPHIQRNKVHWAEFEDISEIKNLTKSRKPYRNCRSGMPLKPRRKRHRNSLVCGGLAEFNDKKGRQFIDY